jgi:hypothetical protein
LLFFIFHVVGLFVVGWWEFGVGGGDGGGGWLCWFGLLWVGLEDMCHYCVTVAYVLFLRYWNIFHLLFLPVAPHFIHHLYHKLIHLILTIIQSLPSIILNLHTNNPTLIHIPPNNFLNHPPIPHTSINHKFPYLNLTQ